MQRAQTAGELIRPKTKNSLRPITQQQFNRDIHYQDSINKKNLVDIQPKQLTFKDIQVNFAYEEVILVRNMSMIPRRIRIAQPKTQRFRVDYDMQGALAAGLSMKLVVYFESKDLDDYHDVIVITSEDGFRCEIPIHALQPQADISFDSFVDLGYAQVGQSKLGEITFTNSGQLAGKVNLKSQLTITPNQLIIQPGQVMKVQIEYFTNQPTVFRGQIQVIQPLKATVDQIEVSCIAVDYAIFFIDNQQAQTTLVDFQELILGSSRTYLGQLVNNTPIQQEWRVIMKKGFHSSTQSGGQLQTPNQVGMEWLEKVIRVYPEKGTLGPYGQVAVKIECKGHVSEKQILQTQNFAFKEKQRELEIEDFGYSLFFEFMKQETLIVHVQGKHLQPQVHVSRQSLVFGECMINETKDAVLIVENTHKAHTVDISFTKAPQFLISPSRLQLAPLSKTQFIVTFAPKNVGRVQSALELLLIDGQYPIHIVLQGHALFNPQRRPITRGPEALPHDFDLQRQYVDEDQIQYLAMRRQQIKSENQPRSRDYVHQFFDDISQQSLQEQQARMQGMSDYEQERYAEKLQMFYQTRQNQEKYNEFLKSQRQSRAQKKREQIIQLRVEGMHEQLKQMNIQDDRPVDLEFQLGLMDESNTSDLALPNCHDGLFVTKPISKYEPISVNTFHPDPTQPMKKPFPATADTHKEKREVSMDLTGEELQKIQAGPIEINFGAVFVKSRIARTFHIKNDLRTSISVEILIKTPELQHSYSKQQIIPSSDTGRFEIVLQTDKLGPFEQKVQYIINSRHSFEFNVKAVIEQVRIELSNKEFKFQFKEENHSLETIESIKLTNPGNATARFKWVISEQKVFFPSIMEGEIEAGKTLSMDLLYKPSNYQLKDEKISSSMIQQKGCTTSVVNQIRTDDDKLSLTIVDGKEQSVKVNGWVFDAKCILKQQSVDMKELLVCKSETKFFSIRNVSRVAAVFRILNDKLPAACDIVPLVGRIQPDESKDITVKYMSKEQTDIKTEITIMIRGGRVLKIPFNVKTIVPQVEILQDQFDFGKLTTLGNEGSLKMTISNNSSIPAELILNLDKDHPDAPDGIECLRVVPENDLDKSILKSIHEEQTHKQADDSLSQANSDNSDEEDLDQIKSKNYFLTVQGNSKIDFFLKFSPRDVKTYTFELPITLNRFGRLASLTRQIVCRGLKPRFVMDPQQVEFPRKIITSMEKLFPSTVEIRVSNPERKTVSWRMDVSGIGNVFSITPTEGKIDSGQTVKLKAMFNPSKPDNYIKYVPVYIDSQDSSYLELILKGQAAQPKIQFDRREVLLPTVPLNIEAQCTFRILNDGYENLNIRHKVYGEEGNISVSLKFPEGTNIGMSKKRLRVDAIFQSKSPISFTTRIEFYDEVGKVYTIPISGTADNCLLTCYSYMQRCQGEYKIEERSPGGPIILSEDYSDLNSEVGNKHRAPSMISRQSSLSGRSTTNVLGYSPIPLDLVEQNKLYATKWMKFFLWTANIHSFPDGVIEQDGAPMFELVSVLANKPFPLPCQSFLDKGSKKYDRVAQLLKQYDEFIRMLKSEGALLNHIRPYHLLSFSDLSSSFRLLSNEELEIVHPSVFKITQTRFQYISIDSWCAVLHQVIKIYSLQRLNPKTFRMIPGITGQLPDAYINGSNLYSPQEGMLLRWFELCTESSRLKTFEALKDGHHVAAVLNTYVGPSTQKYLSTMKQQCETEQDFKFNAQKILQVFNEIKFNTPLELMHIAQPSHREMLIFALHLFNQITYYLPKGTEVFQCVLSQQVTRTLLLSNKTNKPISYWVKLEKDEDFKLEAESIKIDAGMTNVPFKIKFISRLSQPVTDRVTFMAKRDNNTFTGAMVYDLKSQIIGRESKSREEISGVMYEQKDFQLTIQHDFEKKDFGTFAIKLIYERIETKKGKVNPSTVFPAIFCRQESIRLKRGQTVQLMLQYIPLVMETQKCLIIFTDPEVGEFQHEVIATAELPEIQGEPKSYQVYVDQTQQLDLLINPRNDVLLRARKSIESLMPKKQMVFPGGDPEITIFDVELSNNFGYIMAPKTFQVNDIQRQKFNKAQREKQEKLEQKEREQKGEGTTTNAMANANKTEQSLRNISVLSAISAIDAANNNKMPLTFTFKNPIKEMPIVLTLKSQDKTDVRRIKLSITALPKPQKADMEMRCPAREQLIQDIPINNPTDRDWTMKITLAQDGNLFSMPQLATSVPTEQQPLGGYKDLIVKRKSKMDIKLHFSPKWMCKTDAHLTIVNQNTNDIYDYNILGIGEEPLAQQNIVVQCKARMQNKTEILLYNHGNTILKYKVETDLINASGLTSFQIQPQKKYRYELIVMPMLSGQYNGSITFYEESGEYIWYTVVLDTESPMAEKEVDIVTQARKAVAFDIEISNPMPSEQATFEVTITGEFLYGAKFFTVLPQTSSIYELIYLPHLPERAKAQIGFVHYKLGEIWYNLNLCAEERQAIRVPTMRAELGKVEQHEISLENPTGKKIEVTTVISNMANFDVLPTNIELEPFESTRVYIRYIPSVLDQVQTAEITFKTASIGKWEYLVYGVGTPPTNFSEIVVTVGINRDYSDVIHFKNPFKENIQVQISIEDEDGEAFQLLLKRKNDQKIQISGLQSLQIPFSFTPRQIRSYRCNIVVAMNEKVKWKYPILGHTESFATGRFTQFKTKCRIQFIQDFKFQLPGVGLQEESSFSFELKNIPEKDRVLIEKFFRLRMLTHQLIDGDDNLHFEAQFTPLKPFKTTIDLLLKRDSGGVWKFPLQIEATVPDPDDLILITSPLKLSTSVSFRVTNRNKSHAYFKAYFLPASDQEFQVSPKEGSLEPNGREGTQFIISFMPLEYGQIKQATLIIETEDMYWSYLIRGTLPKYQPPVGQSKIDNAIIVQTQSFKPKNFLMQNIRKSNSPNQKLSGTISNMNFTKKTMGTTLRDSKSQQASKAQL